MATTAKPVTLDTRMLSPSSASSKARSAAEANPARLPELDGIRGLAIVLVLIWHLLAAQLVIQPRSTAAYLLKPLAVTWAGVDLFFVLSGFLIGGILLRNRESPGYFKAFYMRRICRIFPLYYLMLGAFFFLSSLNITGNPGFDWLFRDALPFWSYTAYLQNIEMAVHGKMGPHWLGITWSLAVEEQFYILLPFLIRCLRARALLITLIVLVVAAPIARGLLWTLAPNGGIAGYVLLPTRWDSLFLGVLGAIALREPTVLNWVRLHRSLVSRLGWLCVAMILVLTLLNHGIGSWGMAWFGHTLLAIMSLVLVVLTAAVPEGMPATIFRNRVLVWMGTISYGVYLMHQPISGLFHGIVKGQTPRMQGVDDCLLTGMALAATLALATVSWLAFERYIVAIGQRVRYDV